MKQNNQLRGNWKSESSQGKKQGRQRIRPNAVQFPLRRTHQGTK